MRKKLIDALLEGSWSEQEKSEYHQQQLEQFEATIPLFLDSVEKLAQVKHEKGSLAQHEKRMKRYLGCNLVAIYKPTRDKLITINSESEYSKIKGESNKIISEYLGIKAIITKCKETISKCNKEIARLDLKGLSFADEENKKVEAEAKLAEAEPKLNAIQTKYDETKAKFDAAKKEYEEQKQEAINEFKQFVEKVLIENGGSL